MLDDQTASNACFVCRKHRGEIIVPGGAIYEDALLYAVHIAGANDADQTAYVGWLIVEPKRHAPGLGDLTAEEAAALGVLVSRLARALCAVAGAEHVYSFVLGDHVPHLHVHLAPRYPGTPRAYWGTRVDEWPQAPRGGPAEMAAVCAQLRHAL